MDKIKISKLDETIYHEELENGLNIYIYKKEGFVKKGAYFVTNYGSSVNDFKPINENKIKSYPKGIAHFLEHKLFESSDNESVFDKFKKYGADVNAYTNHFVTNYYFSTIDNFNECLIELIDFVQSPHFTDENVEKEKGIIYQEINMTNDNINRVLFEEAFNATLLRNPNKYKTIGDKKNVGMITKEQLYECYNTFYHPSNMVLVIYGNIDVSKTIELVKENQRLKDYKKQEKIKIRKYKEDAIVAKKQKTFKRNVTIPRVCVCYKIKIPNLSGIERYKKSVFISMLLEMKFGGTSSFEKDLLKDKIIDTEIGWSYSYFDDVIILFFETSTRKKEEFIKIIDKKIKDNDFEEKKFELNKKAYLTSIIKSYEKPSVIGSVIFNQVFKYGKVINDVYDIYNDYEYHEFIEEFNNLNLENKSVICVNNKEE